MVQRSRILVTLKGHSLGAPEAFASLMIVRVVVVAQLVERLLWTPEIRGLYPDIGKVLLYQLYKRKDENKEKEAGNGKSLKKIFDNRRNLWLDSSSGSIFLVK